MKIRNLRMLLMGALSVLALAIALAAAPEPVVQASPPVNMAVTDADVRDVLMALASVGQANMIIDDSVKGKITIQMRNIPFATALGMVAKAKGLLYRTVDGVIVVAARGKAGDEDEGVASQFKSLRVFKLKYARVEDVLDMLRLAAPSGNKTETGEERKSQAKSGTAGIGSSAASSSSGSENNSLTGPTVVIPEDIKRIHSAGRLKGDIATNSVIFMGTDEEAERVREILNVIDVPEHQIMLETQVVVVQKGALKSAGIDWRWDTSSQGGALGQGTYTYSGGGSETFKANLQAQLYALVGENKAKLMARPKIITQNGKAAKVLIGDKLPIVNTTTSGGATTTSTTYVDAGIILYYTPRIEADGSINATLYTGYSTPIWDTNTKNYRITVREAETNVRMKDGETIVIGGLIGSEDTRSLSKIPILGDLPVLGWLFKNMSGSYNENELVILLTAKIIS